MNTNSVDEFAALGHAKTIEAQFFEGVEGPLNEALRAERGNEFLRNYIRASIAESAEMSYVRQTLPAMREQIAKEGFYLMLTLIWQGTAASLGDSVGRSCIKSILTFADRNVADVENALEYIGNTIARCKQMTVAVRADHLARASMTMLETDHLGVHAKLVAFVNARLREMPEVLDIFACIAEPR